MGWPALLLSSGDSEGTHYIHGRDFPTVLNRHHPKGQAWKYRGKWTTYIPNRALAYKNVDRLGVKNDQDFWQVMSEAQAAGQNPPTSMADLFLSCYDLRLPLASAVAPFKAYKFGGWPATLFRGTWTAPAWQYDLNSAYRWAACAGLPDLRSGHPTKSWKHPLGVWVARVPFNRIPYAKAGGIMMVTSEERDYFSLQTATGAYPLYGWAFEESVDMRHIFDRVDARFPTAAKRIGRAFWGMWNTRMAPEQWSWRKGEKMRNLKNPFFNPIWSAFVTSRVKMRMAQWLPQALSIYTDAVITKEPCIPTSPDVGAFKLVREFPRGLWIKWAGHWGDEDGPIKHAGIAGDDLVQQLGD